MTTSENQKEPQLNGNSPTDRKNKGGRPKGGPGNTHHRLNIYVSDDEYKRFMEFVSNGWYDQNASSAGRYLPAAALLNWQRGGRKPEWCPIKRILDLIFIAIIPVLKFRYKSV